MGACKKHNNGLFVTFDRRFIIVNKDCQLFLGQHLTFTSNCVMLCDF